MAKTLFLLHLLFIIITIMMLYFGRLSIIVPLIFVLALFLAGLHGCRTLDVGPLITLTAGYLSQLIGILSSFFVLTEGVWDFSIEPFEFIAQIWQTPLYPLYPILPRTSCFDFPLYFVVTITASFVLPLIPALGASLSRLFTGIRNKRNSV
ncbi:MAG: hypothetical protein PHX16_00330 [Syntrophaceticus sp.]|nr:hypothetical protein [Syntrophaceticus sp.]MDD4782081.1 hypothetical protein [Syntrophaceticus sp.]